MTGFRPVGVIGAIRGVRLWLATPLDYLQPGSLVSLAHDEHRVRPGFFRVRMVERGAVMGDTLRMDAIELDDLPPGAMAGDIVCAVTAVGENVFRPRAGQSA